MVRTVQKCRGTAGILKVSPRGQGLTLNIQQWTCYALVIFITVCLLSADHCEQTRSAKYRILVSILKNLPFSWAQIQVCPDKGPICHCPNHGSNSYVSLTGVPTMVTWGKWEFWWKNNTALKKPIERNYQEDKSFDCMGEKTHACEYIVACGTTLRVLTTPALTHMCALMHMF